MLKQCIGTVSVCLVSVNAYAASAGHAATSLFSSEMLFKGINFILLLFLLNKFAKKPMARMLSSSAETAKKTVDGAKSELEAAKKQLSEYREKIADLEKELEARKQSALEAMEVEKNRIIEDAKSQAEKMEAQTQSRIQQDLLTAKAEIRDFLANESVKLAEKTISEQISDTDHKALIDDYAKNIKKTA